jgi:ATP-dependent RNA helicase RhlE
MPFKDLHLNKPILKAIEASGYTEPTLVQGQTIPLVLAKRDEGKVTSLTLNQNGR